jgi:hypothetical protein
VLAYLRYGPYDGKIREVDDGETEHRIARGDFSVDATYRRAEPEEARGWGEAERTAVVFVWVPGPS